MHLPASRARLGFRISLSLFVALRWMRGGLYWLSKSEVVEATAQSRHVAEQNRAFVAASHEWIAVVWLVFPCVVVILVTVVLTLGIGHLAVIAVSGAVASALLVTGVLFPATLPMRVLAVLPVAALLVALVLLFSQSASIADRGSEGPNDRRDDARHG